MIRFVIDESRKYADKFNNVVSNEDTYLVINYNGFSIGAIDYKIYKNKININYIFIDKIFRKRGLATKVIDKLIKENNKIIYGYSLPEAISFWKSVGAKFDEIAYLSPFKIIK